MVDITKVDKSGLDFLIGVEGLELDAYQDSKGVWTIGVGCTYYPDPDGKKDKDGNLIKVDVKKGDKLPSRDAALELLARVIRTFEEGVVNLVEVPLNQKQFNALVSFCYNLGVGSLAQSSLLKFLNGNRYDKASFELVQWCKVLNPKTKQLEMAEGLVIRRMKELLLFNSWDNRKIV